ncbi:NAD(P)H-dependent oxidoreductase [uncultured Roseibium sp.]|uniref:FMN-dependent NADH-azoreductase n=1 Tax=uncultured Roseibium sp. TaxID=1936171 RepID=UPI00261E6052|nr:NAD(P)H-dependent oxidoreductase [uncultured Roseibium sp.]
MTLLLRINSSSRQTGSHSTAIADHFEASYRRKHPDCRVITRNVADGSIPIIGQKTIEGFYTEPASMTADLKEATALSDELIAELQEADTLLIAAPIYNFAVPAALKAWIDQIVRVGHTFSFDGNSFQGLAKTRRAVVISAYGAEGYLDGQPFAAANFVQPYLKFLLSFLGVEDIRFIAVQGTVADPEKVSASLQAARQECDLAA